MNEQRLRVFLKEISCLPPDANVALYDFAQDRERGTTPSDEDVLWVSVATAQRLFETALKQERPTP